MIRNITIESEIRVEFDENSPEFKELFENYNRYFVECDLDEFSEIIALHVLAYGARSTIEGIGLIQVNGIKQRESYFPKTEEIDHPVNVVFEEAMNRKVDSIVVENESVNL